MGFTSWLYTNSTKPQVVKIVHPGGHAELHDRPVLASEIITRNPRCCVAHPHVFQQPWAIVSPETTLMPGQKFYVVPIATVRRLQKLSLKYYPSQQPPQTSQYRNVESEQEHSTSNISLTATTSSATCWLFEKMNSHRDALLEDSRCQCLRRVNKIKANNTGDSSKEFTRLTNNLKSAEITMIKKNVSDTGSMARAPKRLTSLDQWQPGLESVCEE